MKTYDMRVRITLLEGLLGTSSNDKEVYSNFIGSKAPDAPTMEEEIAGIGTDAFEEKTTTVFHRLEDGTPIIYDYQIRGFFKESCGALNRLVGKDENGKKKKSDTESSKITAHKKVVDQLIFVKPRKIPLKINGEINKVQRPLRAQTAQGERVALASSEMAPAGTTIEFTVKCLSAEHIPAVREWLDYGYWHGLGQWRNSGAGSFVWEELDENGKVIGGNKAEMEELSA